MKVSNLFDAIPRHLPQELMQDLVRTPHVTIERIVSRGHRSAERFWYDQGWDEWVLLVSGNARLAFADPPMTMNLKPGDHLLIPAHTRHRVAWTAEHMDTVWLAVHMNRGDDTIAAPSGDAPPGADDDGRSAKE
jgi:cupin 2 domain-containing protein